MSAQQRLREAIDHQESSVRASVPADRPAATLALLRAQERLKQPPDGELPPDVVTGRRIADLGGNKALQLCLEAAGDAAPEASDRPGRGGDELDDWCQRFLHVWSVRGLTTQPLLFLTREPRRRTAQEYHNSANRREARRTQPSARMRRVAPTDAAVQN